MVMLIGLPGCGKTTWVNKFIEENPDKKYDVIGTATLIEKMKVDGEPKKKHLEGKWDQLIQKSTRCLQDLLRTASQRRRNVIIDQVKDTRPKHRFLTNRMTHLVARVEKNFNLFIRASLFWPTVETSHSYSLSNSTNS